MNLNDVTNMTFWRSHFISVKPATGVKSIPGLLVTLLIQLFTQNLKKLLIAVTWLLIFSSLQFKLVTSYLVILFIHGFLFAAEVG